MFGKVPARHAAVQCAREEGDERRGADLLLRAAARDDRRGLPGDIIGIPNHGTLHVGDSLTEGEALQFTGIPNFAPEILRRVVLEDAMRAKQLNKALNDLAEEGVIQTFRPVDGSWPILGAVGALQLDVLVVASEGGIRRVDPAGDRALRDRALDRERQGRRAATLP